MQQEATLSRKNGKTVRPILSDRERREQEAFVRLRVELTEAFNAPDSAYGFLTAAEVIARNRA